MPKRRRFAVAILLVALVATFFLPPVYWRVIGWVKGEAFYDGRPTSWWEAEIQTSYVPATSLIFASDQSDKPFWEIVEMQKGWYREEPSNWYQALVPERFREIKGLTPPLTDGDPTGLPVLRELVRSNDPKVRRVAIWGLDELRKAGIFP